MALAPLTERIARYLANPDPDAFAALAIEAFAELYRGDGAFREASDRAGAVPGEIDDWRAIPVWPPEPEAVAEPTGELERDAYLRAFRGGCLGSLDAPPILDLDGSTSSALALERCGGAGSARLGGAGRVEVVTARSWLAARQRDRRPAVILADRASLGRLLGALDRQDLRFQLAPESRLAWVDCGSQAPAMEEGRAIAARAAARLGLGADGLVCQISWAGVPTPLFAPLHSDGRLGAATASPWTRFAESPGGSPGKLSIFDLSIRGRPCRLATATNGSVERQSIYL